QQNAESQQAREEQHRVERHVNAFLKPVSECFHSVQVVFNLDTRPLQTVVMLMENITEPQAHVEGEWSGIHPKLGLIDRIERVSDTRVERDAVVRSEPVAELCSKQTA